MTVPIPTDEERLTPEYWASVQEPSLMDVIDSLNLHDADYEDQVQEIQQYYQQHPEKLEAIPQSVLQEMNNLGIEL